MDKSPDKIVADIDAAQNEEDKGLPKRMAKAAINLVKPKATKPDTGETTNPMGDKYAKGGNVKSPTMSFQTYTKTGKEAGMKTVPVKMSKGGSASARADGCCTKGKTRGKMM